MNGDRVTFAEAARRLREWPKAIDKEVTLGVRRWSTAVRTAAVTRLMERGIGFSVWGLGKRGVTHARKYVKRLRVVKVGDIFKAGWTISGLPALVEVGGRTKPHRIARHDGKPLRIRVGGGRWVTVKQVQHPGSRINARPFLAPTARAMQPAGLAELEASLVKAAQNVGIS